MALISFGINHKTASIGLREQLSFPKSVLPDALHALTSQTAIEEAVMLSTCNRTEIYAIAPQNPDLPAWLAQRHQLDSEALLTHCYYHQDLQAVKHMMRVACGLDSMVMGEPQILGQMKEAYTTACEVGAAGHELQQLFQTIFSTSKRIRSNTDIGKNPVTFAYGMLQIANRIFSDLSNVTVLCIGTGEMIELAARHFEQKNCQKIIIASRTLEKAQTAAAEFQAKAISIGDIPHYLDQADIIISATGSQLPILGKGAIENASKVRRHQPMLIFDLAVPRDVETQVADVSDVYLYNIDDLQSIIEQNKQSRIEAAKQAEAIVEMQAQHYMQQLHVLNASDLIADYRQHIDHLKQATLDKALAELDQGASAEQVLQHFAHHFSQKIMHHPTVQMRKAAYNGELELLKRLKQIFS